METRIIVCGGVHFNDYEDLKSKMEPLVISNFEIHTILHLHNLCF